MEYFNPELNYDGQYPRDQLARAKKRLIRELKESRSMAFQRVKNKINLDSFMYGRPVIKTLPPAEPYPFHRPDMKLMQINARSEASATVSRPSHQSPTNHSHNQFRTESPRKRRASVSESSSESDLESKQKRKNNYLPTTPTSEDSVSIVKCDLCDFYCDKVNDAETHLTESQHFSASRYRAIPPKNGDSPVNTIVAIEMKKVVINPRGAKVLVICPECHSIFPDIFMCGLHYISEHHGSVGCYTTCAVLSRSQFHVPVQPTCFKCEKKNVFQQEKSLRNHWTKFPEHCPLKARNSPDVLTLFTCASCCGAFHTKNECIAIMHAYNKHINKSGNSSRINTLHLAKPQEGSWKSLPHIDLSLNNQGITSRIGCLKKLKTLAKKRGNSYSRIRNINAEIDRLKCFAN